MCVFSVCLPVAPLCFLYNEPSKLYSVFKEMYIRYFFRLHSISSSPSVSQPALKRFPYRRVRVFFKAPLVCSCRESCLCACSSSVCSRHTCRSSSTTSGSLELSREYTQLRPPACSSSLTLLCDTFYLPFKMLFTSSLSVSVEALGHFFSQLITPVLPRCYTAILWRTSVTTHTASPPKL